MALLIGQRLAEKGFDRLQRLAAEAGEKALAAALGAEQLGIELERRLEIGAPQPAGDALHRRAESLGLLLSRGAQPLDEAALATIPGELEQRLLVETDQRALQEAG